MFYVYVLRSSSNQLYIGQTNNLKQRLKDHLSKGSRSSKFSKDNSRFKMVYKENINSRLEAMRREKKLKGWTRIKKEALIKGDFKLLKKL